MSNGRLENGVALPGSGRNFVAYSSLGGTLGRTYVHSKVKAVVLNTYQALETTAPGKMFMYGETGWKSGGKFRPHRTHQNGLSVDFMVPVLNNEGKSVPLPTSPFNRYGYDIEFDSSGKFGEYQIDFEAMARHLNEIRQIANREGVGISLVIFDPLLMPQLFRTKHGAALAEKLKFMKGKAWVRHDEHYHIDFSIPCRPM